MNQPLYLEKLREIFQTIDNQPTEKLSELAKIAGLDLAEDYVGADLSDEDLSGDNLSHANLSNANLSNANLSNTDLSNVNLTNVNLSSANLSYAILSYADLSNANLSNANLFCATLSNANLNNANLSHANCRSTNLLHAKHLTTANVFRTFLITATMGLSKKEMLGLKERGAIIDEAKLVTVEIVGNRAINIGSGNYNESIQGNYVQGDYSADKYNLSNAKFGGGFAGDKGTQIGGTFNDRSSTDAVHTKTPVKTILILAANPTTTLRLRLDEEVREIDAGLQRAKKRELFDLKQRWAVRVQDVYQALLDFKPQIVHFSGHGSGNDGLVLEDETGNVRLVDTVALAELFKLFAGNLECVVLNACYSEVQASAIAQHIPYVIGMKQAIGDQAAIKFATGFYNALGAGESVEFAYKLGCSVIQLEGIPEHLTPNLKKKQ